MIKKTSDIIILLIVFCNPLTIYWYWSFYHGVLESTFAMFFGFISSCLIFYRVEQGLRRTKYVYYFLSVFSISFIASVLWLIISQFIFSERVFGFELGMNLLYVYGGLGLLNPLVLLNALLSIVFLFKSIKFYKD